MLSLSSSRMTHDWPWLVGSMLTRRSSSLSPAVILIRPSWVAAALGDVHLGEDLDAGEQRAQQPPRRAVALDQHAVDAVANPDPVFERLDVDVARPAAAPLR